jgi:hypothetical protein
MRAMRHMLKVPGGLLVSSLLITPVTSLAQKRPDSSSGGGATTRRDTMLSREADLENRELRLRLLTEPDKTRTPSVDDRKLILSQIFEDFEHIQIANREMMQASSSLNVQAYKRISRLADEMNKRARRLKTNLGIPDLDQEKKEAEPARPTDAPQLKDSLQALSVSVKSFVTSPIFKDPRVTTVGELQNLKRDISNVIELSRTVKKVAVQLR